MNGRVEMFFFGSDWNEGDLLNLSSVWDGLVVDATCNDCPASFIESHTFVGFVFNAGSSFLHICDFDGLVDGVSLQILVVGHVQPDREFVSFNIVSVERFVERWFLLSFFRWRFDDSILGYVRGHRSADVRKRVFNNNGWNDDCVFGAADFYILLDLIIFREDVVIVLCKARLKKNIIFTTFSLGSNLSSWNLRYKLFGKLETFLAAFLF